MRISLAKALACVGLLVGLAAGDPLRAGLSTEQNPSVAFGQPGDHSVTLNVCYHTVCNATTQMLTVLDPHPQIAGATVWPTLLAPPVTVELHATGSGKPPLTYSWRVVDALGATVATFTGSQALWQPELPALGSYAIYLDLSNAAGTVTSDPIAVDIAAGIFGDGFELGDTVAWSPPDL